MKKLLLVLLLLSGVGFGQISRQNGIAITTRYVNGVPVTAPLPFSSIFVCVYPGPCNAAYLATLYTDQTGSTKGVNPVSTDADGNFGFWAAPGNYQYYFVYEGVIHGPYPVTVGGNGGPGTPGQNGQDGAPGAPGYSPNQITSGCGYVWVSGLTWNVAACNYIIQNQPYASAATTVTGPAADPSLDRFDSIVVDKTGTVSIVAGTPSANPAPPSLDISSQLAITFYRVNAGATQPANILNIDLYHENLEWTCTGSATINCASTAKPHSGTISMAWTNSTQGAFGRLTAPSGTIDLGATNQFSFWIYTGAQWTSGVSLTIQWFNGTTGLCTPVTLTDGNFNFSSASTSWQLITIPSSLFNCNGIAVNRVQFLRAGVGTTSFYIDDVVLQGGTQNTAGNTGMVWRRAWQTSTAYKILDTVKRNGNAYVAIADSSGNAPEANPSQWDALTDFAPAGVDGNLQIKQGFAFGSINTTWDPSTQTLTFPGKIVATELDSNATTGQGLFLDAVTSPVLSSAGGIAFESVAGVCYVSQNGGAYVTCSSAFGGGSVASTRRVCMMQVGDGTNTVSSSDYSPFKVGSCTVPYAAHIVEVNIQTDAGTPSVLLQRRRGASTVADLLSGALAAAGTTHTCALASTSGTCIDGTTSSGSITLSNAALSAGDVIEVKSGTASSETSMRIAVIFTVD